MELPQYTVYIEIPRLLFPKTLRITFLGLILYILIWVNFFMLKKDPPRLISILILIFVIILIFLSIVINYVKYANYQYRFYSTYLEYDGEIQERVAYNQITQVKIRKNAFDIIFNTGKIDLGIFSVNYVPNLNQVYFYLQKMTQMSSQNTYYQQPPQTPPQYPQNINYGYSQNQNNNQY